MQVHALIMRMVITPSHFIATLAQARPKSTKSFNCDYYYIGRSLPSHCSKLSLARPLSSQVPPAQKLSEEDKKLSEENKKNSGITDGNSSKVKVPAVLKVGFWLASASFVHYKQPVNMRCCSKMSAYFTKSDAPKLKLLAKL